MDGAGPTTSLRRGAACSSASPPGRPAFQLRKGEEGLSVFDLDAVDPPLTEAEILEAFRPGSYAISVSPEEVTAKGLCITPVPGVGGLPERLRDAHAELVPGPGMVRAGFKQALKELESHGHAI
jgi:hypothetical protein